MILPILVIVAIALIAWLLFTQRTGKDGQTSDTQVTATKQETTTKDSGATEQAGGGAAGSERAVDAASDAATVAGARTAAAGSYTSASVLDSAFNSDPDGAAARYSGPVRVSGTIASMVQPGPTPSLSMEGRTRFNYIVVSFPAGYGPRLAPLMKGQFISVSCDGVRSLGGTTLLQGCLLN